MNFAPLTTYEEIRREIQIDVWTIRKDPVRHHHQMRDGRFPMGFPCAVQLFCSLYELWLKKINCSGRGEKEQMRTVLQAGQTRLKYKIHWHVLFTHFPVSFFLLSTGFMLLHLFTVGSCYELAAFLSVSAGVLVLVPTTTSGWLTWKRRYKGMRGKMFLYKIKIAFGMIALGVVLVSIRLIFHPQLHIVWMWTYPAGIALLLAEAMIEGFYGGRLNHR